MNIKELKGKSPSELAEQLLDIKREQFKLRMQRGQGQLTQTHQFRTAKRTVARIKMLLAQKAQ
jgi:large subunit ribosomal protein L29